MVVSAEIIYTIPPFILGKIFGVSNRQSKYRKQNHENPNRKGSIIGQNNQVTYEWQWIDNEWQWKPKIQDVEEEYNWSPSRAYQLIPGTQILYFGFNCTEIT